MRLSLIVFFWASFIACGIVYAIMLSWTLPSISAAANGLPPFDLRPFGYGVDEAVAFLGALTDEGRKLYLNVQHPLDIAYPLLLALVIGLGLVSLTKTKSNIWNWTMACAGIPGMLFDYRENALVREMLLADPKAVDPDLVSASSFATLLKSVFTTIALCILLFSLLFWMYRKWAIGRGV